MGTVAVIGLLLAAGFAFGGRGSGRSGSRRMPEDEPQELCAFSPTRAASLAEAQRFAWLECDGRTAEDAAALVVRLRRTDNAAATRAEARWNAIRSVVEAQPDGQLESAEARATAERVERGEHVEDSTSPRGRMTMGEVSVIRTADARRLTGPVVRALRARRNYRQSLIEFQRAAGILADGRFGPQSYNALRYYGGDPPMPFVGGDVNAPANQYPPGGAPFAGGETEQAYPRPRADDSFAGSSGRMSRA